ncbi:DoxX family protein [Hydrogenophaga sp. RWCD_12]|uniref:DoxX family protein n=1 Tax=Hydrogenophaga sp. RWCD_12 TaxID=3391190 RepID=UPI003984CAB8
MTTAPDIRTTAPAARTAALLRAAQQLLQTTTDLAALAARAYVAQVFFLSGLTKIRDWDTTLLLFNDEYRVPLLPPELAAVMGTGGELVLPVLLLLGLGGRFAALGLSVVNVVAAVSLPDIAPAALQQHITWGVLLAALALHGVGRWSLDHLVFRPILARRLGLGPTR